MVGMLTEKLLHFISTDICGMPTRFRAQGRETGYDKGESNVVPSPRSTNDRPSSTAMSPHGPDEGTCAGVLAPQARRLPPPLSPTPQPSALCPDNLPVSSGLSSSSKLFPDVEILFHQDMFITFYF